MTAIGGCSTYEGMRIGTARVDITPQPSAGVFMTGYTNQYDKPSEGAHDPLYARVLLLDDGQAQIALVSVDLIGLNPGRLHGRARALGLEAVLLAATHTHGGPRVLDLFEPCAEDRSWPVDAPYLNWVESGIASAIGEARSRLQPATLCAGRGSVDLSFNRRLVRPDGSAEMIWTQNRQRRHPYGPTDPEVSIVRFDGEDGQPLALLCHYACHPVVLGSQNRLLTADFPGYTTAYLEDCFPGALALFLQGGCGDLNPYVDCQERFEPAREQGEALAREVERVARSLGPEAALEEAPGLHLTRIERTFRRFYDPARTCTVHCSLLRLGSRLAFFCMPGEPFVALQLELKQKSPVEHTLLLGYTDGYAGYFPTLQASREGGYGAAQGQTLHVEAGAGEALIADALEALARPL